MLHSLCWHCVGRSSLHNSSQIHILEQVDQIHQWLTRSAGEWMISRSPDPDWQEANLQTTSLFAWHWEISRRIGLRSACYTFGLEANLRWAAMMNQMICSLCVLPCLQTFPKVLTVQHTLLDYIPRGCCERCFQYVRCSFHFYCVGASISLQRQIIIVFWKLGMEWVGFGGFSKKGMWGLSKQGAETALANPSSLCNLRPWA